MNPLTCMALAVYFEARSEPLDGQAAVASVILERVESPHYPNNICDVVFQYKQFSAFNNGIPKMRDSKSKDTAYRTARAVMDDPDAFSTGATHYHTVDIMPYWAHTMQRVGRIGRHVFYKKGKAIK